MAQLMVFGITNFLGLLVVSLIVCSYIYKWIKSRSYPPGPYGLPLVGHLLFLRKNPSEKLLSLSKKYGDIFSFYIGPQHMICISEYQLAKEILNHGLTLARPPHSFDFLVGKGGFPGMNGDEWQEQRRFALNTIRNLGMGKGPWEAMIQENSADLVKEIKESQGCAFYIDDPLILSQMTNSLSLLFGRHLDAEKDHQDIQVIKRFGRMMLDYFGATDFNLNLPWMRSVCEKLNLFGIRHFMDLLRQFEDIISKEVESRLESKEDPSTQDFISCYLKEMDQRTRDSKPSTFTVEHLRGNLFMLFVAGLDSSIASVSWLLLLMVKHPDVQRRVCGEIDRVCGRDGIASYDDRNHLPFTMATLLEMMRFVSINPIFPPRYVLGDFKFEGYTIPQGAHVVCNSWAMLHDPRYFEDPMTFRPERFLNEDGTKCSLLKGYGPFSFGRRNCPGDGVAMMTMYLYFVSIMQKFRVDTPDGSPPSMESLGKAAIYPAPQQLCFRER